MYSIIYDKTWGQPKVYSKTLQLLAVVWCSRWHSFQRWARETAWVSRGIKHKKASQVPIQVRPVRKWAQLPLCLSPVKPLKCSQSQEYRCSSLVTWLLSSIMYTDFLNSVTTPIKSLKNMGYRSKSCLHISGSGCLCTSWYTDFSELIMNLFGMWNFAFWFFFI